MFMKTIYILSGVPGCGKSTWAKEFSKNHPNTKIIASDDIRYEVGGAYQYFKEEAKIWSIFFSRANEISKKEHDVNVILDSTCLTNLKRRDYLKKINGYDHKVLVFFNVSPDVCRVRNKMHVIGKVVLDEPLNNMIKSFETPDKMTLNLFDEYIEIKA
jgi:Predicted kinase